MESGRSALVTVLALLICAAAPAGAAGGAKRMRTPSQPPYWLIIPFILIVIGFVGVMIYLIISDERADAARRADEKKASSLKFGRMDPRYHKD